MASQPTDNVESVEIEEDVFEKTRKELFGIKDKIDPPQEKVEKKKPEKKTNNLLQLLGIPTSDSSSNLSVTAESQSNLSPHPAPSQGQPAKGNNTSRRSLVSFSTLVDAKRATPSMSARKQ